MKEVYERNFQPCEDIDEFTYEIDKEVDTSKRVFLSEWFFDEKIHKYTGLKYKHLRFKPKIPTQYSFPDTNQRLNNAIKKFHIKEGLPEDSFVVFNSEGSTPMITSIILFASQLRLKKIYSVFPLYFNLFKLCDAVNIDIVHCNSDLTCEGKEELSLPNKRSFLIITDPIWVIGRHHPIEIFKQLREWQDKTGSIIFVDGSFSYMDWYTSKKIEPSRILNPYLTFRLICPTKALCLHGLRFSYLLCPAKFSREIARISCSNIGSGCYFSHAQREKIFNEMIKDKPNPVGVFSSERFNLIKEKLEKNNIEYITPECGFFFYANIDSYIKKKGLNKKYLWLDNIALDIPNKKYKGYAKINLISRERTFKEFLKDLS